MSEPEGLYAKYTVIKNSTGEEVDDCFVLRPDREYNAGLALINYATLIQSENPILAEDIMRWLAEMRDVPDST